MALECLEARNIRHRLDPAVGAGNEDRSEFGVDVSLGDGLGAFDLQAGLDSGQPSEPNQIQIANPELGDGRLVGGDRLEVHRDPNLLAEVIGKEAVVAGKNLRILIRDGPDGDFF